MTTDRYPAWKGLPILLDAGDGGRPYRLKHDEGVILTRVVPEAAEGIASGDTSVSTLTTVTRAVNGSSWLDLADYHHLLFIGATDGAEDISLLVEFSDDGEHADVNVQNALVPAGAASSIEVGPGTLHRYWRLSGTTADLSAKVLKWRIIGVPRGE